MGGNERFEAKETFPAEGIVLFSTYAFGLLGVMAGRFGFGLGWAASAFLFIPFHGIACGIVNNESKRLVGNAAILLLFPILAASLSDVVTGLLSTLSKDNMAVTASLRFLAELGVALVGFLVLVVVSRLVVACSGDWHMPESVRQPAVRVLAFVSCTAVLLAVLFGVRTLDGCGLKLGGGMKLVMALVLTGVYMLCVYRIVTMRFEANVGGGGGSLRKSAGASAPRLANRPSVKLADVAGMEEVKRQIRLRLIDPVRDAARASEYGIRVGGGMLLYGPPGTGKTFIAKAVAGELGLPFYAITAADVFGKYVGESEGNIRRLFAEVRKNRLSVVFIDELETLFPKRTGDVHESTRKVISVLLQELDGVDSRQGQVLLLGATNVPWMVDEAFMRPGRFDVRIFVGLPDCDARRQMFIAAFSKGSVPHTSGLTDYLAQRTENFSGADINGIMSRIRQTAYERRLPAYTISLADEILSTSAPSATGEILDRIREWEAQSVGEKSKNAIRGGTSTAERPTTKLADVAGMDEVKEQVRLRIIEPMLHQTLAGRYGLSVGGGMLLYGPPGTGKTFFARAVAGELELPFYMVTAADVFGKYVGESERNVRKLFNDIRKNPLSVVFIDELETLFPRRTGEVHETTRKVISLLLQELDGIDKAKNPILLLGATNVPWMVDEAFLRPGRFDVKVYVGLPDFDARRQMLIVAFDEGDVPHEPGLTAHMAEKTEGYSGADLRGVMARMRQVAFDRRLACYTYALADEILAMTSPTTAPETVARIRQWENRRSATEV